MSTKEELLTPPRPEAAPSPDETAAAQRMDMFPESPDIDYAAIRAATEAMSALGTNAVQENTAPEAAPRAGEALQADEENKGSAESPAQDDWVAPPSPEDMPYAVIPPGPVTMTSEADASEGETPVAEDAASSDAASAPSAEESADISHATPQEASLPADAAVAGSEPPAPPASQSSQEESDEKPMGLLDHLNEMRWRLVRCFIAAAVGFCLCWAFVEPIFSILVKPLLAALPEGGNAIYTSMPEAFFIRMFVAFVAGLFVASPFIFYQIWAFISPGLYEEEKLFIVPVAVISAIFFVGGALFCYYIVFPFAFQFFMSYSTDQIQVTPRISDYVDFVLKLLVAFGVIFEMPLFSFFLARMGVLTAARMRQARRYAILGIFIVAAILTPPDVVSQLLMAVPMLILYEFSVLVAATFGKRDKKKKEEAAEEAPATSSEPEPWPSVFTPSNPQKVILPDVPSSAETETAAENSAETTTEPSTAASAAASTKTPSDTANAGADTDAAEAPSDTTGSDTAEADVNNAKDAKETGVAPEPADAAEVPAASEEAPAATEKRSEKTHD